MPLEGLFARHARDCRRSSRADPNANHKSAGIILPPEQGSYWITANQPNPDGSIRGISKTLIERVGPDGAGGVLVLCVGRLAPYGMRPTTVHRTRNQVRRGYLLQDFCVAFEQYLSR